MRTNIVVGVIGITFVIGGYYFLAPDTSVSVTESKRQPPDGWREYRNERYIFSVLYPEKMLTEEFNEGTGARTFIFENREEDLGFQIFVTPYGEEKISDERFLLDVPLGIRENPSSFYIDGALATSFYSKSMELGDTWEVWFIHKGFLYELTTLKPMESLLDEILETWLFI